MQYTERLLESISKTLIRIADAQQRLAAVEEERWETEKAREGIE